MFSFTESDTQARILEWLRPINARSETILEKSTFAKPFREKRCLLPVDGFYEWKGEGKKKQPYHFRLKAGGMFSFAGIWDVWEGDGKRLVTTCLLTCEANELVRPYHERMPVITPRELYRAWLSNETPLQELLAMLKPFPAEAMEATAVSTVVNSPKYDGPECLNPAA